LCGKKTSTSRLKYSASPVDKGWQRVGEPALALTRGSSVGPLLYLVGGAITPLKNDGVRQIGS